jgi:predicted nucleic acid-binding protein
MSLFYFDTSAILKRYKTEKGSHVIDELFDKKAPGEIFASSFLTALEVLSTASRALRGKQLSRRAFDQLTSRFFADFSSLFQIGSVDNSIIASSITVTVQQHLRPADAIHLATVQRIRQVMAGIEELAVVASDKELIAACRAEGIEVMNPEENGGMEKLRRLR